MLRQPLGRWATEGQTLYWCADAQLTGCAVWGRPTHADLERLLALFDRGDHDHVSRDCDFVVDVREVQSVDESDFRGLVRGLAERLPQVRARTRRHVLVRSDGLFGAAVEGFYPMIEVGVAAAVFTAIEPALAWLGRPDATAWASVLEDLREQVVHGGALLGRLRGWWMDRGLRGHLDEAAQALGVSSRALQRALHAAGSSFRSERDAARLALAESMLRSTDLKLEVVARRLGFRSGAHFSAWFRRHRQVSPRDFRASD